MKVQSDCKLLDFFHNKNNIHEQIYRGIILQKKINDQFSFTYTIFVKELKAYSKIERSNIDLNELSVIEVCFYYFGSEEKKVRCSLHIK